MKEKNFPKKWRYLFGQDIVNTLNALMDNIVAANTIYPKTQEELVLRKEYQTKAIINCYQLQSKLLCLTKLIDTIKLSDLTKFLDDLYKEVGLLKGWKKSSKIL